MGIVNVDVRYGGNSLKNYKLSYTRSKEICSGVATLDVTVVNTVPYSISEWDKLILYEDGTKKGEFYVVSILRSATSPSVTYQCQDDSLRLIDYFVTDSYYIDYPSYAKYWIEKFLTEAGVNYIITAQGDGAPISSNTTLGLNSAYDIIIILLQQSGWYMYFDEDGVAIIGKLQTSVANYSANLTDNDILEIKTTKNDSMLRNRAVVWGNADRYTGQQIFADISKITPWNYDNNDYRTVLLANSSIYDNTTALNLASLMLAEFDDLVYIKEITVYSGRDIELGDTVFVNSSYFKGSGLVTQIESSMSSAGYITKLYLDQRCPRLFGYFNYLDDYVYIGTVSSGIWRKPILGSGWSNFSSGLLDLSITDLAIYNGRFACTTSGGSLYTRDIIDPSWTVFSGASYYYPTTSAYVLDNQGDYKAVTINRTTGDIYGLFVKEGVENVTWLVTIPTVSGYTSEVVMTSGGIYNYKGFDLDTDSNNKYISTESVGYVDRTKTTDIYQRWKEYYMNFVAEEPDIYFYERMHGVQSNGQRSVFNYDNAKLGTNTGPHKFHVHPYVYDRSHPSIPDYRVVKHNYMTSTDEFISIPRDILDFWFIDTDNILIKSDLGSDDVQFELTNFDDHSTTVIASYPYPTNAYTIGKEVLVRGVTGSPHLLWYVVYFDFGAPVEYPTEIKAFKLDVATGIISSISMYTFTDQSSYFSASVPPPFEYRRALPIINNHIAYWFPTIVGSDINNHLGLILSIDTNLNTNYYEIKTSSSDPSGSAHPVFKNSCATNDGIFLSTKHLEAPENSEPNFDWCFIDYNLTGIVITASYTLEVGIPPPDNIDYVDMNYASNTRRAVRVDLLGRVYDLYTYAGAYSATLGSIGNYRTESDHTPAGFTPGNVIEVFENLDPITDELYFTYDNISVTGYNELRAMDLSDGSIRTVLTYDNALGGAFPIFYNDEEDYTPEQSALFSSASPSIIIKRDENGFSERFEEYPSLSVEDSRNYPLVVFGRDSSSIHVSPFAEIGTFVTLQNLVDVHDTRVFTTTSGVQLLIANQNQVGYLNYDDIVTSGVVSFNEVFTTSGVPTRIETSNFTGSFPYIFIAGSGIGNFFYQNDGIGDTFINYSSGLPLSTITTVRLDDKV